MSHFSKERFNLALVLDSEQKNQYFLRIRSENVVYIYLFFDKIVVVVVFFVVVSNESIIILFICFVYLLDWVRFDCRHSHPLCCWCSSSVWVVVVVVVFLIDICFVFGYFLVLISIVDDDAMVDNDFVALSRYLDLF